MDLKQLEVFTKLYEIKNFSKVAKEMDLSQPTVTLHIKQLEEELNTVLFKRTTREIKETPDEIRLYSMAVEILKNREKILQSFNVNGKKEVSIAASILPAHFILPEIMDELKKRHPRVSINAIEMDNDKIPEMVANSRVDFGIVGNKVENEDCHFEKLGINEVVFIAPATQYYKNLKNQNPTIETLTREPMILRNANSGILDTLLSIFKAGNIDPDSIKPVAVMHGIHATKQLVIKGIGTTFISSLAIQEELKRGELVSIPIPENLQVSYMYLVWKKDSQNYEDHKRLADDMIETFNNKFSVMQ